MPRDDTQLLRGCSPAGTMECKEVQVMRLAPIYANPSVAEKPIGHLKHNQVAVVVMEQSEGEEEWVLIKECEGRNLGWVKRKQEDGVTVHWMPYYDRGVGELLDSIRDLGVVVSVHGYFSLTEDFTRHIGNRNLKRQLRKRQYKDSAVLGLKKDHKLRDYQWRGAPVIDQLMQKFPETFFTADLSQADALFQAATAVLQEKQPPQQQQQQQQQPQQMPMAHVPQGPQGMFHQQQPYPNMFQGAMGVPLQQMGVQGAMGMQGHVAPSLLGFQGGAQVIGAPQQFFDAQQGQRVGQIISSAPPQMMAPQGQGFALQQQADLGHVAQGKRVNHAKQVMAGWDHLVQVMDSIVHEVGGKSASEVPRMLEEANSFLSSARATHDAVVRSQRNASPNPVPAGGGFYYHSVPTPLPAAQSGETVEEVNKEERGLSLIIRSSPTAFGKPLASIPSGGTYARLAGEFCVGEEVWVCVIGARILVEPEKRTVMGYVQLRGQTSLPPVGKRDTRDSVESLWTFWNNQAMPRPVPSPVEMSPNDPHREVSGEKRFVGTLSREHCVYLDRMAPCGPVDSRFYTQQAAPYFTPPVYTNEGEFITNARGSMYTTVIADSDNCGGSRGYAERAECMDVQRDEKAWVQIRMQTRYGHACDYDDAWVQTADVNMHYLHYYDTSLFEWLSRVEVANIAVPTHSCFRTTDAFWNHFNKPGNLRYRTVVVLCPTSSTKKEDQLPASHGFYWKTGESVFGKAELKDTFRDVYIVSYGREAQMYLAYMNDRLQERTQQPEFEVAAQEIEDMNLDNLRPQVKRARRLWYWLADAAVRLIELLNPGTVDESVYSTDLWQAVGNLEAHRDTYYMQQHQQQQQQPYAFQTVSLLSMLGLSANIALLARQKYDRLGSASMELGPQHINLMMAGWFYQSTPVQRVTEGDEVVTRSDVDVGLIVRSDPSICCRALGLIPTGAEVTMRGGLCYAGKEWYRYVSYASEWSRPGESRTIHSPISGFVAVRSYRVLSEVGHGCGSLTRTRRTPSLDLEESPGNSDSDGLAGVPGMSRESRDKMSAAIAADRRKRRAVSAPSTRSNVRSRSQPI